MSTSEVLIVIGEASLTLFIIIDSVGNLPIISGLFRQFSPEEQRRSIDTSVLVSAAILLGFAALGLQLLRIFGVGVHEMLIAGGLLFLVIGMDMLFDLLPASTCDARTVCIVPVASPLLAGPGAITTVLVTVQTNPLPLNYLIATVSVIIALGASWLILRRVEEITRLLGERGALIVGKLMGIVVTAIAVSFIVRGVEGLIAGG
ncbi:MAG: MarC family protein [Armatimonadota bacterium]|jgi:multiple antibiotic resistance protein